MCRELVAKGLNMFKNFMRIFSSKYVARLSCDGRVTFVRVSRTCRREILAIYNAKFSQHSCECCPTVVRIKMKISYIRRKVVRILTNVARLSHTVARFIFKIRPKFANLSHKCLFNETAT